MVTYRLQKNITITEEQIRFIKENSDSMTIKQMSDKLNLSFNVLYKNMRLLNIKKKKLLYKPPRTRKLYRIVPDKPAKPVDIETNGIFDENKWSKLMKY